MDELNGIDDLEEQEKQEQQEQLPEESREEGWNEVVSTGWLPEYTCHVCNELTGEAFYHDGVHYRNAHQTCIAIPFKIDKKTHWVTISGLFKSHDWREDMKLVNAPNGWWNPVPIEDVTDENGYWTGWSVLEGMSRKEKNAHITVKHKERRAADLPHCFINDEWSSIYNIFDEAIEGIDPSHMTRLFQAFDFLALHNLDWGWLKVQKLVENATGHKPAQQTIEAAKRLWLAREQERMNIKDEDFIWWADERIKHLEGIKERAHPRLQRRLEVQIQMLREQKEKDLQHYQLCKRLDAVTDEWKREKLKMLQGAADAEKRTAKNAERAMKARINRKQEKYDVSNYC